MFLYYFALVLLINLSVNGQTNNLNQLSSNQVNSASLFGQLHQLIDSQSQISCFRVRPNIKNPHPTDNTKYVVCRNEQRYDVFTCPNGGIFNDTEKACIDLCQQKDPCLNQGQCIILADLTLQCVCRRDWTGERCETPLSSCASNPCGPDAECRMLRATDYSQDYVCICDKHQTYGRSCQQTVPNPCLLNAQQFHPFAFSRRAYINCDDELIFFQPCYGNLYWNQENKRCDRELPLLFRAPFVDLKWKNQQRFIDNNPSQSFQNFPSGSETVQNQKFFETTTLPSRVFHLTGFSSNNLQQQQQNTQWSNNGNNQFQSSKNNQPFQTQNSQWNGVNNQNSGRWTSFPLETTTVANNNAQQGSAVRFLKGWQSNK